MGKVKIITKEEEGKADVADVVVDAAPKSTVKVPKKKIVAGTLHVEATFNNTKVVLSDKEGNTIFWTSAGSLGFKGAKKGTPFAASIHGLRHRDIRRSRCYSSPTQRTKAKEATKSLIYYIHII